MDLGMHRVVLPAAPARTTGGSAGLGGNSPRNAAFQRAGHLANRQGTVISPRSSGPTQSVQEHLPRAEWLV